MPDPPCGGCEGLGAHWRWCAQVVGRSAHHIARLSIRAGNLADEVGANQAGAANHLYQAAALLHGRALELAEQYRRATPDAPRRDGSESDG